MTAAMAAVIEADPAIDEIEVNPLMLGVTGTGALAVDAVIWKTDPHDRSLDEKIRTGRQTNDQAT